MTYARNYFYEFFKLKDFNRLNLALFRYENSINTFSWRNSISDFILYRTAELLEHP
jgi:hypothetical protein